MCVIVMTYLLLGPRQLVLKLSMLVEESLVLSAQCCKALGQLISKLRNVTICLITHGCARLE